MENYQLHKNQSLQYEENCNKLNKIEGNISSIIVLFLFFQTKLVFKLT